MLYRQFSHGHPELWTRNGPCEYFMPQNAWRCMKWTLVNGRFHKEKVAPVRLVRGKDDTAAALLNARN